MSTDVKLEKVSKGYFLTITDPETKVENTWAVTREEILEVKRLLDVEFNF